MLMKPSPNGNKFENDADSNSEKERSNRFAANHPIKVLPSAEICIDLSKINKYEKEKEKELISYSNKKKESSLVPKGVLERRNSFSSINKDSLKKMKYTTPKRISREWSAIK